MQKYILVFLCFFGITLADSNIKSIVKDGYFSYRLSERFNYHVNTVVEQYKEPEYSSNNNKSWYEKAKKEVKHYGKTAAANYGYDTKAIAKSMMEKIFRLYSRDLNSFVNHVISDEAIVGEIKKNYDDYMQKSSNVIYSELDHQFRQKFLDIYNANTLNILLKEDIKEKLLKTKEEILNNVKSNVTNGQLTMPAVATGMIISGAIMKQATQAMQKRAVQSVIERVLTKSVVKAGSKAVPFVGWALLGYEAFTVNNLYDDIGTDIKEEYRNNEEIIIDNISNTLSDIDNITMQYQMTVQDIAADFINRAKVPYAFTGDDNKLRSDILQSNNYIYLEILETFYKIPKEYYPYLVEKYLSLPDEKKHKFSQYIQSLNDVYIFENIKYIEAETNFNVLIDEFPLAVDFFDRFENRIDIYNFYTFSQKVLNKNVSMKQLLSLYQPYQILKESKYLQTRYVELNPKDRDGLLDAVKSKKIEFDRIAYFEENNNLKVESGEFVVMAELFDRFSADSDVDKFYDFVVKVLKSKYTKYGETLVLFTPYQILSDSEYLKTQYIELSDEDRKELLQYVKKSKKTFENIESYEENYKVKISSLSFIDVALLLSKFSGIDTIKDFYSFVKTVEQKVTPQALLSLYQPYQILKESKYLQTRYVELNPKDRDGLLDAVKSKKIEFDRIAYFEENNNLKVESGEFVAMAELFSRFSSNGDVDKFLSDYREDFLSIDLKQMQEYLLSNMLEKNLMILLDLYSKHKQLSFLLLMIIFTLFVYVVRRVKKTKKMTRKNEVLLLPYLKNNMMNEIKNQDKKC